MQQYFLYRYKFQPLAGNSRYTPSFEFGLKFTEMSGIVTLTDEMVPESKYNTLPNGKIHGARVGMLEFSESGLTSLGMTEEELKQEIKDAFQDFNLKFVTKNKLAERIRGICGLTEREPRLFVVSEAYSAFGQQVPEKLIDLT